MPSTILAGTPKAVELAKSAGLKTHPNLYPMEEEQCEVSSPAEKATLPMPPTGAGLPKSVEPDKELKHGPSDLSTPEAPPKQTKTNQNNTIKK